MKNILRLTLTLTVICVVAGGLLASVDRLTRDPIAAALRAEKSAALATVLPECDNTPDTDTVVVSADNVDWTFYIARRAGETVGAAYVTSSSAGYGGNISLMVGLTATGTVHAIAILEQKETPGLGAKISEPDFRDQFKGRSIADTNWAVKKDQGDIDQITAATISSRAVVQAIKTGLDVYRTHEEVIRVPAKMEGSTP